MFNSELFKIPFHTIELDKYSFLVTGGAGFVGSNLVEYLLKFGAKKVRVLDNLSNGYFENISEFLKLSNFEFIEGDIRDYSICESAVKGIDFISHQAALGSVPRSISDPILSNSVNISGFLNMLCAAKSSQSCKQFVYAASSSTYGDSLELPKIEGKEGKPLSPYAVTKAVNEMYAEVFSNIYGFHAIGLRYFNIFGPKQNPLNPYAAVIPIFISHFLTGTSPTINGDGQTSRDFTFVENAIQANIKALFINQCLDKEKIVNRHEVFNVACGDQISLNQIIEMLNQSSLKKVQPIYSSERVGDVKHSKASIEKIESILNYSPNIKFQEGLKIVLEYYKNSRN